ncbi:hypothetical protein CABS01_07137 [Colletotrichum abscissum]|uniref:Uncharacterized protein n=1 Tax=Colletotrichum abscissum TaxID=1671311 RepID=A0A9P9X8R6_9PEZI|nr:uncharacterized protein CABS01_07137 [Colletotrichum abscissum]KAI3542893.1 hypothetical protein CABS02_10250 [Colletotrichum abscissum]KAK1513731.1 hypothetical protein CABS01_07137 [Colletotrichum abscissum]
MTPTTSAPVAGLSAGIQDDDCNFRNTIIIAAACVIYTISALVFYAFLNRCRFFPRWYESSDKRLQHKVLLLLWLPATLILWPLSLLLIISSKCGFDVGDRLAILYRRMKTNSRALSRHISGEPREGMELDRWEEIELEEENHNVLRKNTTMGVFINPFDERGRSSTRSSSGSNSRDSSPTDCRTSPSTTEISPVKWYERLPSPAGMKGALIQAGSSSNGGPSPADSTRSESPYPDDGDSRQLTTTPAESVDTVLSVPSRKFKTTRKLQTIPEQTAKVEGWELMAL